MRSALPEIGKDPGVSAAAKVLDRLEGVRPKGSGRWLARCPAHEDRSPSLSIRELEDGRVLIHDFGGCDTGEVLAALGLTVSDLFERPLNHVGLPASHSRIPASDLLEVITHETYVVAMVAADILERRTLSEADWQRLAEAVARIARVRSYAFPQGVRRSARQERSKED